MKTQLTFLLAAGLLLGAVTTTQAQSRYENNRDVRHDRIEVRHDRMDTRHDRREMIHDRRDLRFDRHDLNRDRRY